ncbi:mandelate racemase/muconate lactonizing enzyme family protein [Paenibacillus ferrarius]|uniref:mandelate racemase/muconate lactonizing enzyme family protein n=1 Tax=Paenibacillus ferrarius TaxID=1469647 RepID=UPI003D279B66
MKITAVKCILVSAPYANKGDAEREICLKTGYRPTAFLKVETDAGIYGLGETYAGTYAPEAVRGIAEQMEHDLIGQNPMSVLEMSDRMRVANYYLGRMGLTQCVIGGIEMALWDLKGKALGVPVYELLGGKVHNEIMAYASGGNNKPMDELKQEMFDYVKQGFRAVKIRINLLPDIDAIEEKVAVCREALGPHIGLAVDAAQGLAKYPWSVKKAIEIAKRIEKYNLLWIEEPAEVTNYEGFAEIRRNVSIPVAGGETVTSLVEAESYLKANSLDLFQPDAAVIGGLSVFRSVAQMCERKSIPIAVHAWCGGVGIMGNFHAAFASRNCTILELSNVPNPLREEMMVEPLKMVNGNIQVPATPGLGVHLPDGLEEKYPFLPGSVYRVPLTVS